MYSGAANPLALLGRSGRCRRRLTVQRVSSVRARSVRHGSRRPESCEITKLPGIRREPGLARYRDGCSCLRLSREFDTLGVVGYLPIIGSLGSRRMTDRAGRHSGFVVGVASFGCIAVSVDDVLQCLRVSMRALYLQLSGKIYGSGHLWTHLESLYVSGFHQSAAMRQCFVVKVHGYM